MPGLFSAGSYKPDTVHCFLPSAEIPGLTWSQGLPHFLEKKKDTKGEMPSALRVLTAIHLEHKGSKETASLGGGILEDFKEEAISELGLKGWVGDPKQGRRVERGRQSSAVPHLAHPHTEPLRDTTHHPAPGIRQLRNRRSLRAPPPSLHPWGWQPLHCSAALLGLYQDVPSAWKSSSPLLRLAGPILLISTVLSPPCPCPDCLLTRAVCSSVFLLVSSPHFPPPDRERPAKSRPPAHTPVCSTRKTTGCMCPVAGGEDG